MSTSPPGKPGVPSKRDDTSSTPAPPKNTMVGVGPDEARTPSNLPKNTLIGQGPEESVAASTAASTLKHTIVGLGPPVAPGGKTSLKQTIRGVGNNGVTPVEVQQAVPSLKPTFIGTGEGQSTPPPEFFASQSSAAQSSPPAARSAPPTGRASSPSSRTPGTKPSTKPRETRPEGNTTLVVGSPTQEPNRTPGGRMSPPPELPIGTVFANDFRVLRRIARGGMGTVYEVEQVSTGRHRALKLLHRAQSLNDRLRLRFLQEARIKARIESEHIVDVVVAGADAATGTFWIAMELLEGETLAERLMRLGPGVPMPDADGWRVLTQLSRGLARAHQQGVVHRDLKPANVFLVKGDPFTVKILDFGIAHLLDDDNDHAEGPLGTPLWMAPEQAQRREIAPAADIWAVGLLGFRLFTGRSYWLSARRPVVEMSSLLAEMLDRPLVTASERAEVLGCSRRLPEGFDAWFARCVARDPGLRFRTADEMAIALSSLVSDTQVMPVIEYTPASAREATPALARPYPRRDAPKPASGIARVTREEVINIGHASAQEPAAPTTALSIVRTGASNTATASERPRANTPSDAGESMVRARPPEVLAASTPATPLAAPSVSATASKAPEATARPRSAAETTMKLSAVASEPTSGPSLRLTVGLGALCGVVTATVMFLATHRGTEPPAAGRTVVTQPTGEPTPPMPLPVVTGSAREWPARAARVWNGRLQGESSQWSCVLMLRHVEAGQVSGYFSWTAVRAAAARPGEQVRENVEGFWDAENGTLDLHGTLSTNPFVLPVNAYRLTVEPDGRLQGGTADSAATITGTLATRLNLRR